MTAISHDVLGTFATLLSTEMDGLADNDAVVSSVISGTGVYNNIAGNTPDVTHGDGYLGGYLQFKPGAAQSWQGDPIVDPIDHHETGKNLGYVTGWFLKSLDGGTTFEDGSASHLPTRWPDFWLGPFNAASTAVVDNTFTKWVSLPVGKFKVLVKNDATGVAFPATGNTLTIAPATDRAE